MGKLKNKKETPSSISINFSHLTDQHNKYLACLVSQYSRFSRFPKKNGDSYYLYSIKYDSHEINIQLSNSVLKFVSDEKQSAYRVLQKPSDSTARNTIKHSSLSFTLSDEGMPIYNETPYVIKKTKLQAQNSSPTLGDKRQQQQINDKVQKIQKQLYPEDSQEQIISYTIKKELNCYQSMPNYGKDLQYFIDNELEKNVDLNERFELIKSLIIELGKLHKLNWIHLDLKPANFIYNPQNKQVHIVDFEGAKDAAQQLDGDIVTTPYYAAPEIMTKETTKATDVFSLGFIIAKLLGADHLKNRTDAFNNGSHHISDLSLHPVCFDHLLEDFKVDENTHSVIKEFIKYMTAKNPEHRPHIHEVFDFFHELPNSLLNNNASEASLDVPHNTEQSLSDTKIHEIYKITQNIIDNVEAHGKKISQSSSQHKSRVISNLVEELKNKRQSFMMTLDKKRTNAQNFQNDFWETLNSKNEEIDNHRYIWKGVLINSALAITGIGLVVIAARAIYGLVNNVPLMFGAETTTSGIVRRSNKLLQNFEDLQHRQEHAHASSL